MWKYIANLFLKKILLMLTLAQLRNGDIYIVHINLLYTSLRMCIALRLKYPHLLSIVCLK